LVEESFAVTDDGLRLFVRVVGDGAHTVIVPAAAWLESQLDPLLAPDRRFVFYDTQSRGRSDSGPDERLTFDHEVGDMEAVRRHVGASEVALIGWSYLGAVVALYASRHPGVVANLVMLCPMAPRPGPFEGMQPFLDRVKARETELERRLENLRRDAEATPSAETWAAFQLLRATMRMGDSAAIERVVGNPFRFEQEWAPRVESTLTALFDSLPDFDWRTEMGVVEAPVLVVHGDEDGPVSVREEWVHSFPDGRLLRLPNVGHYPFLEAPDQLFPVVDEHLRLSI
jgi:proline iminopeptidase